MRHFATMLAVLILASRAFAQGDRFPLDSVAIEGSSIPQAVVLEIAGLQLNAPIDKAGIEQAGKKLEESGLFSSIAYRFASAANQGYALTLSLADPAPLSVASIDVPGADENEIWQWLIAKYKLFDHRVPPSDAGQRYLAGQIEQHLGSRMRGQHLAVRMETDLRTRQSILTFQPESLPRVQSVTFSGNRAIPSAALASALNPVAMNQDYTDRKFANLVELNLRPLYEQMGYYRVTFRPGEPQVTGAGVSVNVAVKEGESYRLGKVEGLDPDLASGAVANWKVIQQGMWDMEKVVKRTGFFEARVVADRFYDDAAHILNLRIRTISGPLYRYGQIRFAGLTPELEARAQRVWRPKSGDPYDYRYSVDFFQAFARVTDFRAFRKYEAVEKRNADHVVDTTLVFTPR